MKRKNDIEIGKRFMAEVRRLMPDKSDREIGRLLGCSNHMLSEWETGVTPGVFFIARLDELGADVVWIVTGRRESDGKKA